MLEMLKKMRRLPETSAALRAALAEVDAAIPDATEKVTEAGKRRAELLLAGTDRDVIGVEAEQTAARINLDRLGAARLELERRLVETEVAEAAAALDAERAAVEARAHKLAAKLKADYVTHSTALATLLSELEAAEDAVRSINQKLHHAGRSDTVAAVEERAVSCGRNSIDVAGLRALTSLRPIGSSLGWGAGKHAASMLGLES